MSLVNSDQYSIKSRASSVYQTSGKPLSAEAIYRAKLKYGIYQAPSQQTIGVPNGTNASDTAALLATSTDLSIDTYKRTIAPDAQSAALFARKDTAPKAWTRDYVDDDAASAAHAVGSLKVGVEEIVKSENATDGINAAKSVSAKPSNYYASERLASLYAFDKVRNGAISTKSDFNIDILTKSSTLKAESAVYERLNPEKDPSVYGLAITPKLNDSQYESFAAVGALASQNFDPKKETDVGLSDLEVFKNSLVDPRVLEAARKNATKTLEGVDKYLSTQDLFFNPEFNKAAAEIAKKNYTKREIKNSKINLGGGLYMTQKELDDIARKIVNPVLEDISKQAKAQRLRDSEIIRKKQEQKAAQEKLRTETRNKKIEEKRLKAEAKIKIKQEIEAEKQKQQAALAELEKAKKVELQKHKAVLTAKQNEELKKKEELKTKKTLETKRLKEEESKAEAIRQSELKVVENERDERLAPILANLKAEEEKLAVLNEEKTAIEEITESQEADFEIAQKLLKTSQDELKFAEEKLATLKTEIEESTLESDRLLKESELRTAEADVALKKSSEVEAEAKLKEAELNKEKSKLENERVELELKLEQAKVDALNEEKKIAEILPPTEPEPEEAESVLEPEVESVLEPEEEEAKEEGASKDISTRSVVNEAGAIASKANGAKDSDAETTEAKAKTKSAEPAEPVPRLPSMVDAVIPKNYVPPSKGSKEKAKKKKAKKAKKTSTSRNNSLATKPVSTPAANAVKPVEPVVKKETPKAVDEKPLVTEDKSKEPVTKTLTEKAPVKAEENANAVGTSTGTETEDSPDAVEGEELKPTFSGFSQGSEDAEEKDKSFFKEQF